MDDLNVGDRVRVTIEGDITFSMNGEICVRSDASDEPTGISSFNTEYADVQPACNERKNDFTERELLWIEQTLFHRVAKLIGRDGWMLNPDYIQLSDLHKKLLLMVTEVSKEKDIS